MKFELETRPLCIDVGDAAGVDLGDLARCQIDTT